MWKTSLIFFTRTEVSILMRHKKKKKKKETDANTVKILKYLIDIIFVELGELMFKQTIGIPVRTNDMYVPLLAKLSLYSNDAKFIQGLINAGNKRLSQLNFATYI